MNIKIYQKYISAIFLKNFFIVFFALQFFYLGIDLMQNFKKIPDSANLQILYMLYTFLNAINFTLPVSLVIAMIISKFNIIRTNELVALYALSISKNQVIKPIFFISLLITIFYVLLNFTNFPYSKDFAHNIITNSTLSSNSKNLFLKYFNNYIYINKLDPVEKEAFNIKIFELKNKDLTNIIYAKRAKFVKNIWILQDIDMIKKPNINQKNAKLQKLHYNTLKMLKGFKPKIIENVYEGNSNFSAIDAMLAIRLFLSQNINIQNIKATLFSLIVFPFFAPLLILILFYYMPISNRFFNLTFASSIFIFISLMTWSILFMLVRMSKNAIINPEIGIILPIIILSFFASFLYYKNR